MKGYFLGTTTLGGKTYEYNDINGGMVSPRKFGFKDNAYGGRLDLLGKCELRGIYLVVEKNRVIDMYLPNPEEATVKTLTSLAEKRGIEVSASATKADVLKALGYNQK